MPDQKHLRTPRAHPPPRQPAQPDQMGTATVLMPDPDVLTDLLARYRTAVALDASEGGAGPETRRRVDDVAYTLCISTGTCDVDDALTAAHRRLAGPRADVPHSRKGTPRMTTTPDETEEQPIYDSLSREAAEATEEQAGRALDWSDLHSATNLAR